MNHLSIYATDRQMSVSITYVGASWCKTCKDILPKSETLAKRFQVPLTVRDLDVDLSEEEKEDILRVPTLNIFQDGTRVATYNVNQIASLEAWLQSNVKMEPISDF